MRLDKYLADAGLGTRSAVKEDIRKGKVSINGSLCKDPGFNVGPEDEVTHCGNPIDRSEHYYYMLNKPDGVITATEDSSDKTVMDLLKDAKGRGLFPVGRLDKDTEGLLLITEDGALSHRLLSPAHHVDKTYEVLCGGIVDTEDIKAIEEGIDIGDDRPTLPGRAVVISNSDEKSVIHLTIHEGRYHQVKRMMERLGKPVLHLKRISFGGIALDEKLLPGEYRALTEDEINILKNAGR